MIPKTIHYVWFGGNRLGEKEQRCIESWKKVLPDYSIMQWDESNFDISINEYCTQAFMQKKWAFVSDYARLWILVNYGGIYMDTDVELVKSFDSFLDCNAFAGFESFDCVSTGVLACEKGFPLFEELLREYDNRLFQKIDGRLDTTTNVVAITNHLVKRGLKLDGEFQVVCGLSVFPQDYFSPKNYQTGKITQTLNTCAIHHFSGSWKGEIDLLLLERSRKIKESLPWVPTFFAAFVSKLLFCMERRDFTLIKNDLKRKMGRKNNE